jgi:hypothetical protein
VKSLTGCAVAGQAFGVVKGSVMPTGVLMCGVTGRAFEPAGSETLALHQPKRLESDILQLRIIDSRLIAMTDAAEPHLL